MISYSTGNSTADMSPLSCLQLFVHLAIVINIFLCVDVAANEENLQIQFIDNGYRNVLVAIGDTVPYNDEMITQIKIGQFVIHLIRTLI